MLCAGVRDGTAPKVTTPRRIPLDTPRLAVITAPSINTTRPLAASQHSLRTAVKTLYFILYDETTETARFHCN